jgi:uncharacterized protein YdhG (YjbR/CyaY superfamily)
MDPEVVTTRIGGGRIVMGSAVDEYLARLPKEQWQALEKLRQTIRSVAPEVEEVVRSGVPAFRYNGKPLVSIGAAKRHVALYIMYGAVLETYRDELRAYDTSTTVIRFSPDKPLPVPLVTKLVKARVAEIGGLNQKTRSRQVDRP